MSVCRLWAVFCWVLALSCGSSVAATIQVAAGTCATQSIEVPKFATNLQVVVELQSGAGPVRLILFAEGDALCQVGRIEAVGGTAALQVDGTSNPSLKAGVYWLQVWNDGADQAELLVQTSVQADPEGPIPTRFTNSLSLPILDEAVTHASIRVPNGERLVAVEAGVRVAHPRISDLVFHLVSPEGTRVLLSTNRGGTSVEGMGYDVLHTNTIPVSAEGGPEVYTNVINTGVLAGTVKIEWSFYSLGDRMVVYYGGDMIMDTEVVSGSGSTNLSFGPGNSTLLTIIMNPGNNPEPDTAWDYSITLSTAEYVYAVFTGNTNKTHTSIALAVPPFTNATYIGSNSLYSNGIFYLPEGDLDRYAGRNPQGDWTLEILDNRAGGTNAPAVLLSWELGMVFENAVNPIPLLPDEKQTNTVAPGKTARYVVEVPNWAGVASNRLVSADQPLSVWYRAVEAPPGTNREAVLLFGPVTSGEAVLEKEGTPPLVPESSYYLEVQNTSNVPATCVVQVGFEVETLSNNAPRLGVLSSACRYYGYEVQTNETAVSFQLDNLSDNADLLIAKDSYPTLEMYTYGSFCGGTKPEEINVTVNSEPVWLSPGRWYLSVLGPTNTGYRIRVVGYTNELPPTVVLNNAVEFATTNVVSASGSNDYYRFVVSTNALRAQFEVTAASGDMALVARRGLLPPDLGSFDYISSHPGTNDEILVVLDDSSPVPLSAGDWYITAVNLTGEDVSYTVEAREWAVRGTSIVVWPPEVSAENIWVKWTALPGEDYYVQGLGELSSTNWLNVSPTITAGDYSASYCVLRPTPCNFFRVVKGRVPAP